MPDGGGELASDLDAGDLAAALAAETLLGLLVLVPIGGVQGRVGGGIDERPAQVLRTVLGERAPVVPAARLADDRAESGVPGELLGGRRTG